MTKTTLADAVAAPADTPNTPAVQKPQTQLDKMRGDNFVAEVAKSLPKHVDAASFVRHAISVVAANDDLKKIAVGGPGTAPHTIISGVMRAASLGLDLDPSLGQAYLVPRRNNGVHQATFQIGYQGYLELVMRTGKVRRVEVERVYSRDKFEALKGSEGFVRFEPDWFAEDRGDLIGWYALVELEGGVVQWRTISKKAVEAHRDQYAPKGKSGQVTGPWASHFEAMGDKTAFLQLVRWLPKSAELAEALGVDADASSVIPQEVPVDDDVVDAEVVSE